MKNSFTYKMLLCAALSLFSVSNLCGQNYNYASLYPTEPRAKAEMGITLAGSYMFANPSTEYVTLNPRMGVRGALSMAICWYESYALQVELAYLYNKIEAENAISPMSYDVKSSVMEIPVMFSYRGLHPLRFNVGATFSIAGTGRYDVPAERVEFGRLRPTLGMVAGVGVSLSQHFLLEVRYTSSFSDTTNYFEGFEFPTRSHWLTFGVGYMF